MTPKVNDRTPRRAWQRPQIKFVGELGELLQIGGGKLSPTGGDPGEMRVQKPAAGS